MLQRAAASHCWEETSQDAFSSAPATLTDMTATLEGERDTVEKQTQLPRQGGLGESHL